MTQADKNIENVRELRKSGNAFHCLIHQLPYPDYASMLWLGCVTYTNFGFEGVWLNQNMR